MPSAKLGVGRLQQIDATLIEIPAGGKSKPHQHLAEEIIYVVSGTGYTNMWVHSEDAQHRYDWDAGDLLSPSLNSWHQHFNPSADTAARYLSITTAPITQNIFPGLDFLSSSDFVFTERWEQGITQQPEYTPEGGFESSMVVRMRVGHQLPDLPDRPLKQRRWRPSPETMYLRWKFGKKTVRNLPTNRHICIIIPGKSFTLSSMGRVTAICGGKGSQRGAWTGRKATCLSWRLMNFMTIAPSPMPARATCR
jgi:quercetin dioxygenase-like cupin family protein